MKSRHISVTKDVAMKILAAGVLLAGAAVACATTAAADPAPPVPAGPAVPPVPGQEPAPVVPAEDHPLTGFANYLAGSGGQELLLGQTAVPAVPGTAPVSPPSVDVLDGIQLLMPQNYRVPTPDQTSPYALSQGTPGPFARVDSLKGVHAIVHGALGRMPADELGQPLPGTAPPPGTNIPLGPERFLPDPAEIPSPPPAPAG
jgi:hypothetical protein